MESVYTTNDIPQIANYVKNDFTNGQQIRFAS